MRVILSAMLASAVALAGTTMAAAQETDPNNPVEPTIIPLAFEFSAEGLAGPGAVQVRAKIEDAQFIGIGEDHGFADAPALIAALASEGAEHGFDTYAIEVGPWSADWLRDQLASGGVEGYGEALRGRPLAIPFLSMREEAEVASAFLEEGKLWGIDQEFIGSPLVHLEWFVQRIGDADGGDELRSWLTAEREAFASGNQPAVFMASAGPDKWGRLREIFARDGEALELVDALELSQSIYIANFTGRGFDNNTDRVALIREYFLDQYASAQGEGVAAPRVLYKMGAVHVGRATSPMKTFDIGSLLEGMAAANGMEALHIAYLPIGGEQLSVRPSADGAFRVSPVSRGEQLADQLQQAGVDMDVVREGEGHFIIDLEPVRRAMGNRGLNEADDMFRFVLLGFDYLVTTNQGRPGTPLAER
ncbi:hypothetical protein [uncultured Erythrobacter sp.]|uniref:hypothetical protein n=1 Tax=uncultured Erythrobacter sp. TaxID=263913 RepID=UPI00260C10F4|nr:hypothetical protein [uncultured Erythrobacter sp.]